MNRIMKDFLAGTRERGAARGCGSGSQGGY